MPVLYQVPKFVSLAHSEVGDGAVSFQFDASDGKRYRVDFDKGCVPLTLAALIAEAGRLIESGHDIAEKMQPIRTKEIGTRVDTFGNLYLVMTLESGATIPFNLQASDFGKLAKQLAALSEPPKPGTAH